MPNYFISSDPARLDLDFIARSLDTTYWAKGRSRGSIMDSVKTSLCLGAYLPDGSQVGFARVVTDRATFAWVCDVIVDPAHRARGLGKRLMEEIISHPDLQRCALLLGTRDAHGLYERFGFKPCALMRRAAPGSPSPAAFQPSAPAAVVQRQLDAFNARDLAGMMAIYTEDAEMFEHPAKLLARGQAELEARFAGRFMEPNLRATLRQRIVSGSTVIDHELLTRTFPEGPGEVELVMIFEVRGDRIARATVIPGEIKLL